MWKNFFKKKPKESGWYMCTVEVKNQQRYTMSLYWYLKEQRFIDNIRENVCRTYDVRSCTGKRIYDIGQDRTYDVVAWRKIPKPYMKGFVKKTICGGAK
jgi:hypothetical protein